MSLGVVVSFSVQCSIGFWRPLFLCDALICILLAAGWFYLIRHDHGNWALLVAAVLAGAIYALVRRSSNVQQVFASSRR
jgi:hypothetical protein